MGDGGAAAAAGTLLPRDAIFDILSWAPFKSVCRFRCVSKEWLALISDPAFIAQHRSRSGPLLVGSYCFPGDGGLLVMDMKGNVLRTVKGLGPFPVARSSLVKLVCVYCPEADGTRLVDVTTGNVLVTFPSTDVGTRGRVNKVYAVSVGCAAVSNSRKVVRITEYLSYNGQPQQACHVLTLGQHDHSDWRQAPSPPALVRMLNFESSGVIANGVVYFLFAHKPALADSVLRLEWSKTIQGPLRVDMEFWNKTGLIRLTQLNETLCMIQTEESQTDDHRCTNIWLLIDADNRKWNKTYVIQMPVSFYMVEPLCFMPDGIKLLLCYHSITISPPVLRVYDPSVGTCTDAMKMPKHTCGEVRHCNLHLDCFGVGKI